MKEILVKWCRAGNCICSYLSGCRGRNTIDKFSITVYSNNRNLVN